MSSKNRNLKRQLEKKRIEEEEDDLLKTDKERELIGINKNNQVNKGRNNNNNQQLNQENDDNEDLDLIEGEEGEQNEEEFNKLVNVHKLIQKNKITKQNAFDIDIGDVQLYKYSWVNSSNFLKNLSEIHGLKIDNIHQDSYKLLGLINRTDNNGDEEQNENDDPNQKKQQKRFQDISVEELLKKTNKYKNIINIGDKTLEQRPENLNVIKYDLEFDLDPLLKQTLSKFDDSSNKGLFLTNSYMDKNIIISLESELQEQNDIIQQEEEQKENLKITETQNEQEEVKESIYMKFMPKENPKEIFAQPQLCPKLMDYKENIEKLANAFKIDFQITDSDYQKLRLGQNQLPKDQQEQENNDQIENMQQENFNYGDLMGQLDEIMDNPYQDDEQQDPNNPLDLQYEDLKQQEEENQIEENKEQIDEEEQDEQDEEGEENEDLDQEEMEQNDQQKQLDMIEIEQRLKNIGKGKLDKKLKDKMRAYELNDEKKQRRKRNVLQKLEQQQQKHEKKKENEFIINFENLDDEDKEICFGLHNKKVPKIDLKKININEKIVHLKLDTFHNIINEQLFTQLYLSQLPKELALQQQNEQNQISNLEDIEMNELLEEQFNSSDEEVDFFAQNNQNNEKSQVKIRDLKKNVWMDIKKRFDIIHKKAVSKKESKKIIPEDVHFSTILEDIPNIMGPISKKISLQSSFITILHLCNENLLKLEMNEDGSDFQIIDDDNERYKKGKNTKIEQEGKNGNLQNNNKNDNNDNNKNNDNDNESIEIEDFENEGNVQNGEQNEQLSQQQQQEQIEVE
ncbi:hypothetical protein PPERSA_03529 [Pseudocohnilembus persalinus]|uniref:Condensin complex subunit 2 n=1 Tax=Pseudocohnilembus persalinus TaxID=266149 RepID=A0A0V0Q853_PSEPJ|nr:hypothetical protein PPERSA_03529 [Pseudocohnilembus persalinus]|eukprot:KRW98357.1 hypothetical protein PPERSA_03529 [Pseudocohnilembus persalinus]